MTKKKPKQIDADEQNFHIKPKFPIHLKFLNLNSKRKVIIELVGRCR